MRHHRHHQELVRADFLITTCSLITTCTWSKGCNFVNQSELMPSLVCAMPVAHFVQRFVCKSNAAPAVCDTLSKGLDLLHNLAEAIELCTLQRHVAIRFTAVELHAQAAQVHEIICVLLKNLKTLMCISYTLPDQTVKVFRLHSTLTDCRTIQQESAGIAQNQYAATPAVLAPRAGLLRSLTISWNLVICRRINSLPLLRGALTSSMLINSAPESESLLMLTSTSAADCMVPADASP